MRVCDFCMKPGKLKDVIFPVIDRWKAEYQGKEIGITERLDTSRYEVCPICMENLARLIEDFKEDLQETKND